MKKIGFFSLVILLLPHASWANRIDHYQGVARDRTRIVYTEKHEVEYDDQGKLISAKTLYENPDGKLIAELTSDFRKSLTVPEHTVRDFRTGDIQGLRRSGNELILFDQEKGKTEKTRSLNENDSEDRILVGCQGLNYYVLENLDSFSPDRKLLLRFLIPGKLDYYDFDMKELKSKDKSLAEFEIKINNWFLKLFAPSLHVKYDRKTKKIVWYEGISNIQSDSGGNQKVTIDYQYEGGKQ